LWPAPSIPPRRPLCRTCDDTGVVRLRGGLGTDACPDCARNAEMRWVGAHAAIPILRRPDCDVPNTAKEAS